MNEYKNIVKNNIRLEDNRVDFILTILESLKLEVSKPNYKTNGDVTFLLNNNINALMNFTEEPVCTFPNVNLWMLSDEKPIGMVSIDISELIWSNKTDEIGQLCFQKIFLDIKVRKKISTNIKTYTTK